MTIKTVREIRDMAQHYIQQKFADDPGFKAAYIIGSINYMNPEDPFPLYRDIDIGVITDSIEAIHNEEENLNGYIVETVHNNPRFYAHADDILSDNRYAGNIAADSILLDPSGFLTPLHTKVKAEFPRRKWVKARCERARNDALDNLHAMKKSNASGAYMFNLGRHLMYITGALTTVHLYPPTHRRGFIQLRDILHHAGDNTLYEECLQAAGLRQITPAQAEQFLSDAVAAFDRAIEVFKTPIPYAYKLEPFIRPYLLEGTKDIFRDQGYRESIFWIARFYIIAAMVILNDGSAEEKPDMSARLGSFLHTLGIDTEQTRAQRTLACEHFYNRMGDYIEKILHTSPVIID